MTDRSAASPASPTSATSPTSPSTAPRAMPVFDRDDVHQPRLRRLSRFLLGMYMRAWHDLRTEGLERLPARGPALVLSNHVSILDVVALAVANPWPDSTLVVKASAWRVPGVRHMLDAWRAIPVAREGRDIAGLRAMLGVLREGRVLALAAEGRRSRTGRLGDVHPVLARLALSAGAPLIPVGVVGSYEALPPGARIPRRHPIRVRIGEPFRLARDTDPEEAARRIRREIAALLPPERRPLDDESGE